MACGGAVEAQGHCFGAGCDLGGAPNATRGSTPAQGREGSASVVGVGGSNANPTSGGTSATLAGGASGTIVIPPITDDNADVEESSIIEVSAALSPEVLDGVTFTVSTVGDPGFIESYQFAATPPTRAYESRGYCGTTRHLNLVTCDVWQVGCLSISIDLSTLLASANFYGPDGATREFRGTVKATKAPLSPSAPSDYGIVGTFDFVDEMDQPTTLSGHFGVVYVAEPRWIGMLVLC